MRLNISDTNVDFNSGTPAQVAMSLTRYIRHNNVAKYQTEESVLTLYRKCYKAASGQNLESILEEK